MHLLDIFLIGLRRMNGPGFKPPLSAVKSIIFSCEKVLTSYHFNINIASAFSPPSYLNPVFFSPPHSPSSEDEIPLNEERLASLANRLPAKGYLLF